MSPEKREAQTILDKATEQIRTATNPFVGTPNTAAMRKTLTDIIEGIMRSVAHDLGAIFVPDVEVSGGMSPQDVRIRFFFLEDELECEDADE